MFSSRRFLTTVFVSLVALAGVACAAPTGGDDKAVGSVDSDLTETGQILGDMGPNDLKTGPYSGAGARGYSFTAVGNDKVTADISLVGGDPVGFMTDSGFTVLAQNDDGGSSSDSKVSFTVPAGGYRSFRVLFKDQNSGNGTFKIKLTTAPGQCNPAAEPWHEYRGTPDECQSMHVTCTAPARPFGNLCGCGCENPG